MFENLTENNWRTDARVARVRAGWCLLFFAAAACCYSAWAQAPANAELSAREPRLQRAIDGFRNTVPELMSRHKVPGAAIALVDRERILWAEGFGHTTSKGKTPVTPDTPFFLGGISKLITATAVMLAAQDGLVDLDLPIASYLPDFHVRSRYEENPERLITIRRLLTQTGGLPVEAPLGNYFEPLSEISFEKHTRSMYGNWLVYPVGKAFQAGNASLDLAAFIVQVRAKQPYQEYLEKQLFAPLSMAHTTVDQTKILATESRAIGHMMGISKMPSTLPSLGAASVYSSARDLAKFIQLHLNEGIVDGRRILDPALIRFLHTPAGIVETNKVYHGAGVYIDQRGPERRDSLLWSDGWGFGFNAFLYWYPEYGIGMVVLSNRLPNPEMSQFAFSLTDRLIAEKIVVRSVAAPAPDTNRCVGTWWGWPDHRPSPIRAEWEKYSGKYRLRFTAYELEWWAKLAVLIKGREEFTPQITVQPKEGFLCVTESRFFDLVGLGRHKEARLQEISPGVFSAASGIVLDFKENPPRWRNYRLEKK